MTTKPGADWWDFIDRRTLNRPEALAPSQPVVCPLEHAGLIKVGGSDAQTFLHSLASNDFLELAPGKTGFGAICNPKGRMLATFLAVQHNGAYYLALPRETAGPIISHLRMFVLASKVELHNLSRDLPGIGLIGTEPPTDDPEAVVITHPDRTRTQVHAPQRKLAALWADKTGTCAAGPSSVWHERDIRGGFAWVYAATSGKLVPQTANLDLTGGISFSKGCYPGQEVVARLHYLGKLKKRTYLFSCAHQEVAAGDDVYHTDQTTACGIVVDFCAGDRRCYGLAAINMADRDKELCAGAARAALTIEPDPYEIHPGGQNRSRK